MSDADRERFTALFQGNGGRVKQAPDLAAVKDYVLAIARGRAKASPLKIVIERMIYVEDNWSNVNDCMISVVDPDDPGDPNALRQALIEADVGVGRIDHAVAETGQAVIYSSREWGRMMAFLSPIYIGVLAAEQILPDLETLFSVLEPSRLHEVAATMTLVCGSSASGDIEHVLVSGVHGPLECHVLWIERQP